MTVEHAIKLLVDALQGSPATVPSWVDVLPQSPAYPAICVRLIGEETYYTTKGTTRLRRALVQVDAFALEGDGADPYDEAATLADRIFGTTAAPGLSGYKGTVTSNDSPAETLEILSVFFEDRRRQFDPETADRIVSMQQDFRVTYRPR